MGSKASINTSADSYIKPYGVVLKRNNFLRWMRSNGYNYFSIAHEMRIHPRQLMRKLYKGKPFPEGQIRRLTFLLGARDMFFIIQFPTRQERKRVYRKTFGHELYQQKRQRGRRQRIIWAK